MGVKACAKCKVVKEYSSFLVDTKMRTGHSSWCCECINSYKRNEYRQNRTAHQQKNKRYRDKNKERINAVQTQWRQRNKDYAKGKLLQKYWPEITWVEALQKYQELYEIQKGLCAICQKPETCPSKPGSLKSVRDLCVDHRHADGKVRGLLCDRCNTLIAKANDCSDICIKAAEYLKRTE